MSPLEVLADELGAVAGQIEREARLKIERAVSDLEKRDAERELRVVRLEQELKEKAASLRDGRDGVDGKDGRDGEPGPLPDITELETSLKAMVSARLETVRDGVDGAPGKDGRDGLDGKDGRDADPAEIAARLIPEVERAVAAIPAPRDGKDADPELAARLVATEVERAVGALPVPKDGRDGIDGKDGAPGAPAEIPFAPPDIVEMVSKALAFCALPPMSTDARPPEKPRQKTITMTKDRNGNAVAHVVEETN